MLIREYTEAIGVSGCENEIRDVIRQKVSRYGQTRVDKLGNLIVNKSGGTRKIMISAHMDEVGFIVTSIKDDGRIKFAPVGGIDKRILVSKRVVFAKNRIVGVIGSKPIHLQNSQEAKSPIDVKDLFIDIGAASKEEAEQYVKKGDYATFQSSYVDMGRFIKSRALDDRVGCAIVTELLEDNYNLDLYGVFTVMEEVGLRGAGAAAFSIEPEIAIVIEGTTCADIAKNQRDHITTSGLGPAISIMDRTSSANGNLLNRVVRIAEQNNIPYQFRRGDVGSNDAGRIHRVKRGCITVTISVPTRYIHSPVSMINKDDYENTLNLVRLILRDIEREEK